MVDNPFQKILDIGLGFFKGRQTTGDSVVGIDIGSSYIKVVQLKNKGGKAVLETYGEAALGPYAELEAGALTSLSNEKLSEALNSILKESDVTTKNAIVAIPSSSSLIFTFAVLLGRSSKRIFPLTVTQAI